MSQIAEEGGYDVEFVGSKPPHNVTCCICLFVLREPMQAEQCGHRFCQSCVEGLRNRDGAIVCPEDRNVTNIFKDKGKRREIVNTTVKCGNKNYGCTVTCRLGDLQDHTDVCDFQLMKCPNKNCKEQFRRNCLASHTKEKHSEDRVDLLERRLDRAFRKIDEQEFEIKRLRNTMKTIEHDAVNQVFYKSYVWKVNQFSRKFENARSGYNQDPQERTFFTSKGYCMTAEVYLNGVYDYWNRSLTIEFSLDEGPFDDSLKWPMAAVVTASLMHNDAAVAVASFDTKRDRINFHKPDPNSSGVNFEEVGLIDVHTLYRYCVNDAITIKIDISHY